MRRILAAVIVTALVVALSGCGPSKAQIDFVKKVQAQVKALTQAFQDAVAKQGGGINSAAFDEVAAKATQARDVLQQGEAPDGVEKLRSDAKDLFALMGSVSTRMADSLEYASLLKAATAEMSVDMSGATKNRTKFIKVTGAAEKRVRGIQAKLMNLTPPPAFKDFHNGFVRLMDDLADGLHDAQVAVKKRDRKGLNAAIKELKKVQTGAKALTTPNQQQIIADVLSPADTKELERLGTAVDDASNEILNK